MRKLYLLYFSLTLLMSTTYATEPANHFANAQELGSWVMNYHVKRDSLRAVDAALNTIKNDEQYINNNKHVLYFFKLVFKENPSLLDSVASKFNTFNQLDKNKLVILAALTNNRSLKAQINSDEQLKSHYKYAKTIRIPKVGNRVRRLEELDLLWSKFFATGSKEPIVKIVKALEFQRYSGAIIKLNAKNNKDRTAIMVDNARKEAIYRSVMWSLMSNCSNIPLVHTYCIQLFKGKEIDDKIKEQLSALLYEVKKNKNRGSKQKLRIVK